VERGMCSTVALYLLRLWPFGVTLHHRSRDHFTRNMQFPTGGQL